MIVAIHLKLPGTSDKASDDISVPEGWELRSFMDMAKAFTSSATGFPLANFESQEINYYLGPDWSYTREERFTGPKGVERKPVRYHLSPKIILTKLYELGREIHSNFWVNALLNQYTPEKKWVVLLMYPNEFAAVKDIGGFTIFADFSKTRSPLDLIKGQFDAVVNTKRELELLLKEKLK